MNISLFMVHGLGYYTNAEICINFIYTYRRTFIKKLFLYSLVNNKDGNCKVTFTSG